VESKPSLEPARRPLGRQSTPAESGSLPEDLQRDQLMRVQALNSFGVVLWGLNFAMDAWLAPHGDRGPYRLLIEALGASFSAIVALYARYGPAGRGAKIVLSVACMVPHAFALALLNSWTPQPTTMRPLSGITVLILLFGMLAPARPRQLLAAAFVAAAMDPLAVWIAHLRGLPVPSPLHAVLMFYPNYACALLVAAPSCLLYRLGRQIREARALGSYELVDRLGGGGMGEVWRARHRLLARSAAVKVIRPELLNDAPSGRAAVVVERFEREAQATAALTSPHTVRLYDFGLAGNGTFYYAMELLEGRDLESIVKSFGPMPAARAMHLIRQVCRSLAEAHAMGLVHRDIKPTNIFVCRQGLEHDFVKVLDFGLVKHTTRQRASAPQTMAATALGTPAYMAPEVILGGAEADCRADVYAVGCVAYFLLTGERVFEGKGTMAMMVRHVHDRPVPPSRKTRQPIPPEVDAFVLACLRKDPNERPASAVELLSLADAIADHGGWDQTAAARWWRQHLPGDAQPAATPAPAWPARPGPALVH
jgi:serine/threonine-protein kinase